VYYGVIAVRNDSPLHSLGDVAKGLRADPRAVIFGAGGTIGSQDWFKAALVAMAAGANHKSIRFVAFEGGGDAIAALRGGHVSVFAGDAAEVSRIDKGVDGLRVLAVLSKERIGGNCAHLSRTRWRGTASLFRSSS
jgi:putative tricarboxylic transport membrane protein